ncbi:hypothetical protein PSTT_14296 [Puccinia striiformis]|uniref:Asparagine synthetase domain-containing protein n=1 Tax=Puccinia striiformis TaxID=27350 RepID=A0A2S4UMR2_9BASI|nr:hypothetical protein PSTT_14296 [Puccinia striiformis]
MRSIAAALCFAARGIERCRLGPNSDECIPSYCCPARVFLSGLGADELLRGYSRHRSAFSSQSPRPNSIEELQLDMERILRNRGRHDQTIAIMARSSTPIFRSRRDYLPFKSTDTSQMGCGAREGDWQ